MDGFGVSIIVRIRLMLQLSGYVLEMLVTLKMALGGIGLARDNICFWGSMRFITSKHELLVYGLDVVDYSLMLIFKRILSHASCFIPSSGAFFSADSTLRLRILTLMSCTGSATPGLNLTSGVVQNGPEADSIS